MSRPIVAQVMARTDADWTMEGRAALGHEVLDVATTPGEKFGVGGFVATVWFAWQLGIDDFHRGAILRPLMARMAAFGLLTKAGQAEISWLGDRSPCYWALAIDRHEAHERWDDVTRRRGWWSGRNAHA